MALVDIKTGMQRKKFVEFIVVGDEAPGCRLGDIRWAWWDRHKTSPMLRIEYRDKNRTEVKEIGLDADYQARGWKLLREMYRDDPAKAKHWDDFVAFADAQMDNPIGMAGKAFPEQYLPTALVEMRKKSAVSIAERTEFVFPSGAKLSDIEGSGRETADADQLKIGDANGGRKRQ